LRNTNEKIVYPLENGDVRAKRQVLFIVEEISKGLAIHAGFRIFIPAPLYHALSFRRGFSGPVVIEKTRFPQQLSAAVVNDQKNHKFLKFVFELLSINI
jgi:hypothetical protein